MVFQLLEKNQKPVNNEACTEYSPVYPLEQTECDYTVRSRHAHDCIYGGV